MNTSTPADLEPSGGDSRQRQQQAAAQIIVLKAGNTTVDDALPQNPCPARDWSQLQHDLLVNIFIQLQVPDLVCCGAVCESWRLSYLAVRQLRLCSSNQSPYLIYSSEDQVSNTATLHNLSTNKIYHISLPDPPFRSRYVIGSSHGWLVTADELSQLHLLNPVTGAQVTLPPPATIKGFTPSYTSDGVLSGYYLHNQDIAPECIFDYPHREPEFCRPKKACHFYTKAILSSDPSDGDCIVLLRHKPWDYLSFARVGDTKWTFIDIEYYYNDIFYDVDERLFYAIHVDGKIDTIDLNGPSPVVKVITHVFPETTFYTRYIVRAPWGDLLNVLRQYGTPPPIVSDSDDDDDDDDDDYLSPNELDDYLSYDHEQEDEEGFEEDEEGYPTRGKVTVYTVDLAEQKVSKIKNLRDHALFIGFNDTFMINARDFSNIRPNCVYISDDNLEFIYCSQFTGRKLDCLRLEDDSLTSMPVSDSLLQWPPPVWFRPQLI